MSSYILQGGGISAPSLRSQDHHNLNDAVPIRNSVEGRNVIGIRYLNLNLNGISMRI